jgi:hypothetical protein
MLPVDGSEENAMSRIVYASILALCLSGCATPYVIRMKSGEVVDTRDEPDYDEDSGFYEFEDAFGKRVRMNKDEISSMEPR